MAGDNVDVDVRDRLTCFNAVLLVSCILPLGAESYDMAYLYSDVQAVCTICPLDDL